MEEKKEEADSLFSERRMERLKKAAPRVHCITNYVTAHSVANCILAAGGSPVMACGLYETEDVASICSSLVINIGTLDDRTIPAMIKAGKKAASLGRPIIFDPVGVGASRFRKEAALRILQEIPVNLIRGNGTEIRILLEAKQQSKWETGSGTEEACGIDAEQEDTAAWDNAEEKAGLARQLARIFSCAVIQTGGTDIVTDGEDVFYIGNGDPWMAKITGSGCMLDGFLGAVLGSETAEAGPKQLLLDAAWTVCAWGICGEMARCLCEETGGGLGSFSVFLLDALSRLGDREIEIKARIFAGSQGSRRARISQALCLYAVTDRRFSNTMEDFLGKIEAAVKGGATMVQLREKDLPREEFIKEARLVRKLTWRLQVPLIINDDLETAILSQADGLHIGQEDMPAEQARTALGPERILGVTAKTVGQARAAQAAGADYLGSGAVFGSKTKENAKAMDHKTLQEICRSVTIPVAAIGGITAENAALLAGTGIAGAAVVSGIFGQPDAEQAASRLKAIMLKIKGGAQ